MGTYNLKKYLENTTWIVPYQTLLAFMYTSDQQIPMQDQTVWIIDRYESGYFFGKSYAQIGENITTVKNLYGTITKINDVMITFTEDGQDTIYGYGKFIKIASKKYVFLMQMNSPISSTSGIIHQSFMIPITKNNKLYYNLPFVNLSVPEFIAKITTN